MNPLEEDYLGQGKGDTNMEISGPGTYGKKRGRPPKKKKKK
jgi:hypothetical protein